MLQVEDAHDILAGLRIGGRRQRHQRHTREAPAQCAELHVLGPEVVPPLRHAVRLVDGEQRDPEAVEPRQERVAHQRLGRDVQEVQLARVQPCERAPRVRRLQRRVVEGRLDAVRHEGVDLVLHERDQGRDDDRGARAMQCGHLVTERLAAAGGHEDEGVLAVDQALDDLRLLRTERREAEDAGEGLQWFGNSVGHQGSIRAASGRGPMITAAAGQGTPHSACYACIAIHCTRAHFGTRGLGTIRVMLQQSRRP
jgi:hypothetical protein